jgi:hypothetical protein
LGNRITRIGAASSRAAIICAGYSAAPEDPRRDDPVFASQATRGSERVVIVNGDHFVDDRPVEHRWDETDSDPRDLVLSSSATVQHGRAFGLNRDDLHSRLAMLQDLADTGNRATRPDLSNEDIDTLAVLQHPWLHRPALTRTGNQWLHTHPTLVKDSA